MSLIGNLEDLSLPDILQIISLSKKSGVLSILRGEEEGRILLRQGKVTLASGDRNRRALGEILLKRGMISPAQLEAALATQRENGMKQLLGEVLVTLGFLDKEEMERVVQEQIEETVYYFLTWKEGTFRFELKEVDQRLDFGLNPQDLMSQQGIDTQWLVLEGTRLLDESHRRRETGQPPRPAPDAEEGARAPAPLREVVLVDDDDYFSGVFARVGTRCGFSIRRMISVGEADEYLASGRAGAETVLVVDVVMPSADGRGFLGGLELARRIVGSHPGLALRVITAYPDDSIQDELSRIGLPPSLLKPELSGERAEEVMEDFVRGLQESLSRNQLRVAPVLEEKAPAGGADLEQRLEEALAELDKALEAAPEFEKITRDLVLELENLTMPSDVGLIILRLASELVERGILFKVAGEKVMSLGGFGFDPAVMRQRNGLRSLAIMLEDSPLLSTAVREQKPLASGERDLSEDTVLTMVLGSPPPPGWVILPAHGAQGASLVLYADNGAEGGATRAAEVLEKFQVLAGLVMARFLGETPTGETTNNVISG